MGKKLTRQDENKIRSILRENFEYYNLLSLKGKKEFFKRLIYFIKSKRFIGKEGLKITEEMLVLVGASAIQLTFGLQRYMIAHFKIIMMFPSTFHFRLLNKDLKGGASPKGTLWLSWEAFQHGYDVPDDKRNLGLHEMAHALKLNVLHGSNFDNTFASYIDEWDEVGTEEFEKMGDGASSFLRKYGGTNRMEFFAVAVEHFFEAPAEFQKELPDIYNHLCVLLNQNPLNDRGDFELTAGFIKKANLLRRKFPLPEKVKLSYAYHTFHWSYPIGFFGGIFGLIASQVYYDETLVSLIEIGWLILAAIVIGGIIQYPWLVRTKAWVMPYYLLYLFFGCAPIVCASLLILNYSVTVPGELIEVYDVKGSKRVSDKYIYLLKDNVFADHEEFRSYSIGRVNADMTSAVGIEYTFRKGVLGYWVLEHRHLILANKEEDS